MSESKHTTGPWKIYETEDSETPMGKIGVQTEFDIAHCLNGDNIDECRANAQLISAAPDLFHALEMVRDSDEDCKKDGLPTIPTIARHVIDKAIAKATGKEQSL